MPKKIKIDLKNLEANTLNQLREFAKSNQIKGYSTKKTKAKLIEHIKQWQRREKSKKKSKRQETVSKLTKIDNPLLALKKK